MTETGPVLALGKRNKSDPASAGFLVCNTEAKVSLAVIIIPRSRNYNRQEPSGDWMACRDL